MHLMVLEWESIIIEQNLMDSWTIKKIDSLETELISHLYFTSVLLHFYSLLFIFLWRITNIWYVSKFYELIEFSLSGTKCELSLENSLQGPSNITIRG